MDTSSNSMSSSRGSPDVTVQVAVRIRPQGTREKLEGSRVCTNVVPGEPQVTIGADRSFTFDRVFDTGTQQREVYEKCIDRLVEGTMDGYNATVLAYGQTGSGKTHTMGTAFDTGTIDEEDVGVIPRAINHVFRRVVELKAAAEEAGKMPPSFEVSVQFIELYNEEIKDLLDEEGTTAGNVRIHEDVRGEIYLQGATSVVVQDTLGTLEILKGGALRRTVASTNMNEQSSRSHAIFSLHISQKRVAVGAEYTSETDMEILTAKFHFVDLAGSERLKRTGATGDRAKEGISINCGLLALGNVISALGGASGKTSHVPYRDSKLTRLLQDSLGGNSRTLMIACVSPSDSDFVETLNTLKYANRAKNIKNKVVANQDKSSKLISELRIKITMLENELLEFRQGRRTIGADGEDAMNDQYHENVMLSAEVNQLRFRLKALQETNDILRARNVDLMTAAATANIVAADGTVIEGASGEDAVATTIRHYADEVERMRSALAESQAIGEAMRKEMAKWKKTAMSGKGAATFESSAGASPFKVDRALIEEARADVERMRHTLDKSTHSAHNDSTSDYVSDSLATAGDDDVNDEDADESDVDEAMEEDLDEDDEVAENDGERECRIIQDNLVELQNEITIKERLIDELERSERRLTEVRATYEKKLLELSSRIKATEAERDRMLAEMVEREKSGSGKQDAEASKRIREQYEAKLNDMRREFKKLQSVEKEHKRMQARQAAEQQQLRRFQAELIEMKKVKVDLMKKMKEESKRAQVQRLADAKRVANLDKEARLRDVKIKQLEMKDKQREIFVKRTTEEMNRLRRQQRTAPTSSRPTTAAVQSASNRIGVRVNNRTVMGKGGKEAKAEAAAAAFSLKQARIKWTLIEKKLSRLVVQRQTVLKLEEELERNMDERRQLIDHIHLYERKFAATTDLSERDVMADLVDGCRQKMAYVQDQIQELQMNICEMDGSKEDDEDTRDADANVESVIERCSNMVEAKYLMQHLFNYSLEQSVAAAKFEAANKACEARIEQLVQQSYINEQLLSTVIDGDRNIASEIEDVLQASTHHKQRSPSSMSGTEETSESGRKLRHRTSNVEELLYPVGAADSETSSVTTSSTTEEKRERRPRTREGRIVAARIGEKQGKRIIRTHTLEGHTKAVLSVDVNESLMITGAKDRTAKVWDLQRSMEMFTLGMHPNNVNSVKLVPNSHLALSVSMHQVRVWDVRTACCVRILQSSGQVIEGDGGEVGSRQNTVPFMDAVINAVAVDPLGKLLFTSFRDDVKIWRLEQNGVYGKLCAATHSSQSEVSCLSIAASPDKFKLDAGYRVFTGSRDHYVKMYDVPREGGSFVTASAEFSPPHYDNVTCVLPTDSHVFTAGKDMNIMKFSLVDNKRDHLEIKAHNAYIQSLVMFRVKGERLLASACKEGTLKLWEVANTRRLQLVEEIAQAHSDSINELAANSTMLFTASSDQTVGFWREASFDV